MKNNEHVATTHYFDRTFAQKAIKILPGEYYATTQDKLLVTVLGSCIAVCLYDPVNKVAGMNHFLLPDIVGSSNSGNVSTRYGINAMEILINELMKQGAVRHQIVAKIFGGGKVLSGFSNNSVGEQNSQFAFEFLQTERITVSAKDVGGDLPRKVYFFPNTGEVKVRKLQVTSDTDLVSRENAYRKQVRDCPVSGDVDLFG